MDTSSKKNIKLPSKNYGEWRKRQHNKYLQGPLLVFILSALFFFFFLGKTSFSEEVLLSREGFIKTAFQKDVPEKKSLFFKGEVKEIAQKIMGQHYKKIRFKYWLYNSRSAWILNRIGKVRFITAGFIIDNCKIASVHVLVYRESHGWEIKYPLFRDQFEGVHLIRDYILNKKIDGITGATLSVNSMKKMTQLALAMHNKIPDIGCS